MIRPAPCLTRALAWILAWALACSGAAYALDLTLPALARNTVPPATSIDSYAAPMGVFQNDKVPTLTIKGHVRRAAWRIESPGLTPLGLTDPLQAQLLAQGYHTVFECGDAACGGFDFRFAVDVLPAPGMFINLRGYRFLTTIKGGLTDPEDVVTVLASTDAAGAYLQIIQASPRADLPLSFALPDRQNDATAPAPSGLLGAGHLVLQDLVFDTGTSDLGAGPFSSLQELAAVLQARPTLRLALVGHTDSVGSLEGNIALSQRRANAVRTRLIDAYGIAPARLEAQGAGYLAPVASNETDTGRQANRRVEAVVLPSPDNG